MYSSSQKGAVLGCLFLADWLALQPPGKKVNSSISSWRVADESQMNERNIPLEST